MGRPTPDTGENRVTGRDKRKDLPGRVAKLVEIWAAQAPTLHGGVGQAARSRSVGERSSVCQPSTRRMVI